MSDKFENDPDLDDDEGRFWILGIPIITAFFVLWLGLRALFAGVVIYAIAGLVFKEEYLHDSFWKSLLAGLAFEVWWFLRTLMGDQGDDDDDDDDEDDDEDESPGNSEPLRILDENSK